MKKQDYYFQCSGGLILFVGHPDIKSESFLDLNPGDRITKVGETFNKKNKGSPTLNRVDDFRPYITYVGTRMEPHIGDTPKEMILFQCRKEDTPEIVDPSDNFYIGYIVIRVGDILELKTYDPRSQTLRIYRPEFTLIK
ncbi:hypothetical protein [Sphingobacterium faecium]|uniref:hypothetical protein n=1 Tax=Sphingobacterium faecium TaxID=34087 RepID=UPI00247892D5|nr:hypothetical protein [Sphingobacterium faecium]WGQ15550.1 hypothetical protein QG727_03880 [Sphingobacterium faecium]